jgi:hypothetical protein
MILTIFILLKILLILTKMSTILLVDIYQLELKFQKIDNFKYMEFKIDDLLAKRSKLSELALNSEVPKISDITDLILIIGPSRSGTTILHKILSSHPQINALSGEDSTYVKLFTGCEVNHDNFNDSLSHSPTSIVKGMNLLMSEIGKKSEDKMTPLAVEI